MTNSTPRDSRPMRKVRFLTGLVLSTCGVATMLMVAAGTLQNLGVNGRLSLPIVALCMIVGLMLLGGGFGIMATSAATFDDQEFDRLMEAGNLPVSTPLDSSCDIETNHSNNADEQASVDFRSRPESHAEFVNVSRADPAESGEARLKRTTSEHVPASQTSV